TQRAHEVETIEALKQIRKAEEFPPPSFPRYRFTMSVVVEKLQAEIEAPKVARLKASSVHAAFRAEQQAFVRVFAFPMKPQTTGDRRVDLEQAYSIGSRILRPRPGTPGSEENEQHAEGG